MKKQVAFLVLCLMALTMNAQRCAVLEFKAGSGISQADVDGISAIFITYFRPAGYTMVERTQIDKAIDEQGFQRSKMTESQMVRIGEVLNVSKIVVGDVNVVMGQYNVDVRVINVESGTIAATEGASFDGSSYRATMQSLAQKLAGKIAITSGETVHASQSPPHAQRTEPYVIYGYLKIFPNDLGTFDAEPKTVIAHINQSQQYGCETWRLPTKEELSLMRASNLIGAGLYMTFENEEGIVRLVSDGTRGKRKVPVGYVDLGLESGTFWKERNEDARYEYEQAKNIFKESLPTKEQWQELLNECHWTQDGKEFIVKGPNGNYITLYALGRIDYGVTHDIGVEGWYLSSTPKGTSLVWALYFSLYGNGIRPVMTDTSNSGPMSVRLVY